MDVNVGDRVSIDSLRVGQPRRAGVVEEVSEGLSGARLRVRWDDGHESFFRPSSGNLIVERKGRRGASSGGGGKASGASAKGKATTRAKKPAARKSGAKKQAAKKSGAKKRGAKR